MLLAMPYAEASSYYRYYVGADGTGTTTNYGAWAQIETQVPMSLHADADRVSSWVGLYFVTSTNNDFLQVGYVIFDTNTSRARWFWQL